MKQGYGEYFPKEKIQHILVFLGKKATRDIP